MIKLLVLDISADSRSRIVDELNAFIYKANEEPEFLPQVHLQPVSIDEVAFQSAPDIIVMGPDLVKKEPTRIAAVKKQFPDALIMARVAGKRASLALSEQLARLGADEILSESTEASEFQRKLVIFSRKRARNKTGKLILIDSGKGGCGVTSMTAGIGEALMQAGKRVLLIDLDLDSQDLTRFLLVKPCINENLELILTRQRPLSASSVLQSAIAVWEGENLFVAPPPAEEDLLLNAESTSRLWLQILEHFDAEFDICVVDVGAARGALLRSLYRAADALVFVLQSDPASLFASSARFSKLRPHLAPDAKVRVVENGINATGLPRSFLRDEFSALVGLTPEEWFSEAIPYCSAGTRWPASHGTLYSAANRKVRIRLDALVAELVATSDVVRSGSDRSGTFMGTVRKFLQRSPSELSISDLPTPRLAIAHDVKSENPKQQPRSAEPQVNRTETSPAVTVKESFDEANLVVPLPEHLGSQKSMRRLVSGAKIVS